jgi:hypothetical protein
MNVDGHKNRRVSSDSLTAEGEKSSGSIDEPEMLLSFDTY